MLTYQRATKCMSPNVWSGPPWRACGHTITQLLMRLSRLSAVPLNSSSACYVISILFGVLESISVRQTAALVSVSVRSPCTVGLAALLFTRVFRTQVQLVLRRQRPCFSFCSRKALAFAIAVIVYCFKLSIWNAGPQLAWQRASHMSQSAAERLAPLCTCFRKHAQHQQRARGR